MTPIGCNNNKDLSVDLIQVSLRGEDKLKRTVLYIGPIIIYRPIFNIWSVKITQLKDCWAAATPRSFNLKISLQIIKKPLKTSRGIQTITVNSWINKGLQWKAQGQPLTDKTKID